MSTHALIGRLNGDKSIDYIYCHNDGSPDYIMPPLIQIVNDGKVDYLMALCSISALYDKLDPPEGVKHTFDEPCNGVTIAYHRDRGDDFNTYMAKDEEAFTFLLKGSGIYGYLVDTSKEGEDAIKIIK